MFVTKTYKHENKNLSLTEIQSLCKQN